MRTRFIAVAILAALGTAPPAVAQDNQSSKTKEKAKDAAKKAATKKAAEKALSKVRVTPKGSVVIDLLWPTEAHAPTIDPQNPPEPYTPESD